MAYTKPLISTVVYYHGGDEPVEFEDEIIDGETVRYGSTVRKQILHGDTVDSVSNRGTHTVIPYHSVIFAEVHEGTSEAQTKPEDAFCQ